MPQRVRPHILEELSIRCFGDALPPGWVYRSKTPDYGIDGEVEIFEETGNSTGLTFNVQLRATDAEVKADQVRLEVDELDYYRQLDLPTMVVRFCSTTGSFFWQWASNIASRVEIIEGQKTVSYRFSEAELWTDATPTAIRRTLDVRRHLANFPPSAAVPLRIDMDAIPTAERYPISRAITSAIAESRGALIRASDAPGHIEAFARLKPTSLAVGIDTLTGVTFDLVDPKVDDYLASILYALVRVFRRQRLTRQAEGLASLLVDRALAHHSPDLAFDACVALAGDLTALVRLAVINNLHVPTGAEYGAVALTIAKAPVPNEAVRRAAMDAFFEAALEAESEVGPPSVAAAHYSIGNFYRHQNGLARAVAHYNRARHLRPAYLVTGYFLAELGGILFVAGRHAGSVRAYRAAICKDPNDPDLVFLLGDALLLAGEVGEARVSFDEALSRCSAPHICLEAELKIMVCDQLIEDAGTVTVPRRHAEANRALRPDGRDSPGQLEQLLREVDALNPLARFNLGVTRAGEGDRRAALHHFLIYSFLRPHDVEAWANAAICALGLHDEILLLRVMSVAIHHMGTEAYDRLRGDLVAQAAPSELLAALDEAAMLLLEKSDRSADGFTLRMLDGDNYHSMVISGFGGA